MRIVKSLDERSGLPAPIVATIGNFDGLHRAHREILSEVTRRGRGVVLTFYNHPSRVLHPERLTEQLCTPRHKADLMRDLGIEELYLLEFTEEVSLWSAEEFLQRLHAAIPFEELILGYDARFGHKRGGTPERVIELGRAMGFRVEYMEPRLLDGEPISSGRVREAIRTGNLRQAERLLERPVSYYARVHTGAGQGRKIGFPTANLDIHPLCAPPFGVYAVTLRHGDHLFPGVANYGIAPTLHSGRQPLFEAHLFSFNGELYEAEVELVLHAFLRPEQTFASVEQLRKQIAKDIVAAQTVLGLA